jgi:hypothetical protein
MRGRSNLKQTGSVRAGSCILRRKECVAFLADGSQIADESNSSGGNHAANPPDELEHDPALQFEHEEAPAALS